ncbi:hypothetical protein BGZ82_005606, partial [Podila clonocystis]
MSSLPMVSTQPFIATTGTTIYPAFFAADTDPVDWLDNFERAKQVNGWKDDIAYNMATIFVHDTCKTLLLEGENPATDLATFKTRFEELYQTDEYKDRHYGIAHNYRQADNETADQFIATMLRLFKKAGITDDATKRRL